ncbi:MAG: alpha-L-fucosidase [Anaerolineae bacterium]
MPYQPTWDALREHPVPDWFHDAKLGIFVHWGLYSVPGWAPPTGELGRVAAAEGWAAWFRRNPYAEWYLNSIRISDSPSYHHHIETYGSNFAYDDFVPMFNSAIRQWQPEAWAELFRQAGARYVVLTTKHHDGFRLWPSRHPNPFKGDYHAGRDLVGELTSAVRAAGMRMGLYYSGGLDWTFNDTVIQDIADILRAVPQTPEYVQYANAHWYELIERYRPSVLWNDIAYPAAANLPELFAHYYNSVPDGVINDRFIQQFEFDPATSSLVNRGHFDFKTPEYASFDKITEQKWEATRGIGYSFGYNRNEGPEHHLSLRELIHSFVDIVSKNGNLLLNVGPMADGTIPPLQRERLLGLGQWLAVNGEAIYGTRPWVAAEGKTDDGTAVRFTRGGDAVYAIVLSEPVHPQVTLYGLQVPAAGQITLLGVEGTLTWQNDDRGVTVALPSQARSDDAHSVAYALRIMAPEVLWRA